MEKARKVTIEDVAREANVSITTVSRYLNHKFESMSDDTKTRIQAVIEALDYQPNKFAQGLKGQHSKTVAVVVVNMGYPFCVSLIRSMSDVLSQAGYSLLVSETGGEDDREEALLRSLTSQQVDAVVIQTNGGNNKLIAEMARQLPIVLIDRQFEIANVTNVITNNTDASRQLTDALFAQGYEWVLYVTEALSHISTRIDRLNGYEAACMKARRAPWVVWVDRKDLSTMQLVRDELLRSAPAGPFAVYTANGLIMLDLYPLLRKLNFSVPERMGIATFDEPDWAAVTTPSLTCVRQPTAEMGQLAAKTILRLLKRKSGKAAGQRTEMIASVLVPGDSTALRTDY